MAVLFPLGAVIVYCLFLLTFSERFSVSIWAWTRENLCFLFVSTHFLRKIFSKYMGHYARKSVFIVCFYLLSLKDFQ